ncbi:MAG: transcriptional regulator BetI [Chloroflexota bacterium]
MPKIGMEPIRRRQIIQATMACIYEEGMGKTSLKRIARRAEITSGLILHYFGDKAGLFEAVYRDLHQRLEEETAVRLQQATTPKEQLLAILEAQVCDEMVEPKTVATWLALSAKASEMAIIAKLEKQNAQKLASKTTLLLQKLGLGNAEATEIAEELMILIYGVWLNLALHIVSTPEQARAILFRFLKARIPRL